MILLLGKNELIEQYAEETLKIDIRSDIVYYPDNTVHYTEYNKYIEIAKEDEPLVITTQSLELIAVLLGSDLDFIVITVYDVDGIIKTREISKDRAIQIKDEYGLELR